MVHVARARPRHRCLRASRRRARTGTTARRGGPPPSPRARQPGNPATRQRHRRCRSRPRPPPRESPAQPRVRARPTLRLHRLERELCRDLADTQHPTGLAPKPHLGLFHRPIHARPRGRLGRPSPDPSCAISRRRRPSGRRPTLRRAHRRPQPCEPRVPHLVAPLPGRRLRPHTTQDPPPTRGTNNTRALPAEPRYAPKLHHRLADTANIPRQEEARDAAGAKPSFGELTKSPAPWRERVAVRFHIAQTRELGGPKVVFSRTLGSVQGNARLAEASVAEEAAAAHVQQSGCRRWRHAVRGSQPSIAPPSRSRCPRSPRCLDAVLAG